MRVQFLRDTIYETEGPKKGPKFGKDEVYDFTTDFGNRWLHRGAAEEIGGGEKAVCVGATGPFVPVAAVAKPKAKAAKPAPVTPKAKDEVVDTDPDDDANADDAAALAASGETPAPVTGLAPPKPGDAG